MPKTNPDPAVEAMELKELDAMETAALAAIREAQGDHKSIVSRVQEMVERCDTAIEHEWAEINFRGVSVPRRERMAALHAQREILQRVRTELKNL